MCEIARAFLFHADAVNLLMLLTQAFSEERSLRLLNKIVDIGMRPVGSVAADVAAPAFFVHELEVRKGNREEDRILV